MGAYDDILNDKPNSSAYDDILEKDSGSFGNDIRNAVGGITRSGMGIASNLMRPFEAVIPGGEDFDSGNKKRMARVEQRFRAQGYDPESLSFQGGKLAGDVAVTAPVGGLLAKGAGMVPAVTKYVPNIPSALRSGGMTLAAPGGKVANVATRVGAGATTGGAMVGLSDFDNAKSGAMFGAALPVVGMGGQVVSDKVLKPAARKLMQSAVKPTIEQLRKGEAQVAIDTLLKYGVNPTERGVDKLRGIIDDINTNISGKIASSNATIPQSSVLGYLADVNRKFANQVSPTGDLSAIQGVADDFMAHPAILGQNIPVQQAQTLKQGTYKALKGKYGEAGSAATEAQKTLARGLKEEIGKAVPDVVPLNAEEARLIKTLGVAERRALMELNKNPVGLAALAQSPGSFAAFMADRSAAFKSIVARMLNRTAELPPMVNPALANPAVRAGLLSTQDQ